MPTAPPSTSTMAAPTRILFFRAVIELALPPGIACDAGPKSQKERDDDAIRKAHTHFRMPALFGPIEGAARWSSDERSDRPGRRRQPARPAHDREDAAGCRFRRGDGQGRPRGHREGLLRGRIACDPRRDDAEDERLPGLPVAQDRATDEGPARSEEHTSELQSLRHLVCRLLLEKKNHNNYE